MDKERRNFLKIILIGSGTLLAGKVMGPLFSGRLNLGNSFDKIGLPDPKKTIPSSFKIVENEKVLCIYDSSGEEIFQIDKGT